MRDFAAASLHLACREKKVGQLFHETFQFCKIDKNDESEFCLTLKYKINRAMKLLLEVLYDTATGILDIIEPVYRLCTRLGMSEAEIERITQMLLQV